MASVRASLHADLPDPEYTDLEIVHGTKGEDGIVEHDLLSTRALLHTLMKVKHSKKMPPDVISKSLGYLQSIAAHAVGVIQSSMPMKLSDSFYLMVNRGSGLCVGLGNLFHNTPVLGRRWDALAGSILNFSPRLEEATLGDVLTFISHMENERSRLSREPSTIVRRLRDACIQFTAGLFDSYICNIHAQEHDVLQPPHLLKGSKYSRKLDLDTAWSIIVRAREVHGVNSRTVLAVKNDEKATNGLATCNADAWELRECCQYSSKMVRANG